MSKILDSKPFNKEEVLGDLSKGCLVGAVLTSHIALASAVATPTIPLAMGCGCLVGAVMRTSMGIYNNKYEVEAKDPVNKSGGLPSPQTPASAGNSQGSREIKR